MKIAVVQPVIEGECGPKLEDITSCVQEAVENGTKLMVFPEAYLTGYVLSQEEAQQRALYSDADIISSIKALSVEHDIHIVIGALTHNEQLSSALNVHNVHNTALCFHPNGEVEKYHKSTPLWLEVDRYCQLGDKPFLMFSIDDINFAVLICYDLSNPFGVYAASLSGADVILVPTNWPLPSLTTTADFTIRTRAYESKVFIAASNKIGQEREAVFCGSSCVVNPDGQFVVKAKQFDGKLLDKKPFDQKQESDVSLLETEVLYAEVHKTEKMKQFGDDYVMSAHDPRFDLLLPILEEKRDPSLTSHAIAKASAK